AALSAIERVPEMPPALDGTNPILIVQLEPAGMLLPHALVALKSAGTVTTSVIPRGLPPVFVKVTIWEALAVPTYCPAKVTCEGEKVTAGDERLPVIPIS